MRWFILFKTGKKFLERPNFKNTSKVADHIRKKVLRQLERVCGDSLYCDIMDLEAICAEALEERRVWTNEVYRRKRDVYSESLTVLNETENNLDTDQLYSSNMSLESSDRRQIIEIVFKLVGNVYNCFCQFPY